MIGPEELKGCCELAGLGEVEYSVLMDAGFLEAPASKSHHLARRNGLAEHSMNVGKRLEALTRALGVKWTRPESPWRVALLHDIVKCRCYAPRQAYAGYDYVQPPWPGHGIASVAIATVELGIGLCPDEAAAIAWHMGAFNLQGRALDEFDAALAAYPAQIIATHAADMAASRIDEKEGGAL